MSQAVIHNQTVYLAGQVAAGDSLTAQVQAILTKIDLLLAEAKTDKSKILSATIWLTDMATFPEMNAVWEAWVVPGHTPVRATVASPQLAAAEYRVEIAIIAAQ